MNIDPALDVTVPLTRGETDGAWTYGMLVGSGEQIGTRRAVRVEGYIDDVPVALTLLPMGGGTHMLPVNATLRRLLGKDAGDVVRARLTARVSAVAR